MISIFLTICLLCQIIGAQIDIFNQYSQGDGTFYGESKNGHCSFTQAKATTLPWIGGTSESVALNNPQYGDSTLCGLCLELQGTGPGIGLTPISKTPQYAIVADECPECKSGDLDLAKKGDGRWRLSWRGVQCQVGTSKFQYSFAQGSSRYYIKLAISNTRVPVDSVSVIIGNSQTKLQRTIDNYFVLFAGQPVNFPLTVKITSIFGDTVQDIINVSDPPPQTPVKGTVQFPLNPKYKSVGEVQTEGVNVTTAFPPSATPSAPATSSNCATTIALYGQCGGSGASCRGDQCIDAEWSDSCCAAGSTCQRQNEWYYQCLPSHEESSDTPISAPADAVTAAQSAAIAIPNDITCQKSVQPYSQCGGIANCDEDCEDEPWKGACCGTGFECARQNQWFWMCDRNKNSSITTVPNVNVIDDNKICGGTDASSVSFKVTPVDGPWANTICRSDFVCIRRDEHFWQCSSFPFVPETVVNGSIQTSVTSSNPQTESANGGIPLDQTGCF